MSLIDIARDTLKEIPMADVLRERLSLAFDLSAQLERQVSALQTKIGDLEARLEIKRIDHQKCQQELERLRKEHEEEVRISYAIEFRRGKRTGNEWVAFCPRCHMPASIIDPLNTVCSDGKCHWMAHIGSRDIANIIKQL